MLPSVCLVAVWLSLLGVAYPDNTLPPTRWTVQTFPSPRTQKELCGRSDPDTVMYVCDPNHLLSEKEAQQLEVLIEDVMNTTGCPCSEKVCGESSSPGYRVGVALMAAMDIPPSKTTGKEINQNLNTAQVFAHTLLNRWSISRCREDVLILYSENNTVLYTATGEATSRKLTSERVGQISMSVQRHFYPSGDKFTGLRELISTYRTVFNGQYEDPVIKVMPPKYEAVIGGSDRVMTFTLVTVTLTLLAALLLI